eukprot:INCI6288.1.p1 GENE.INCI6288.1~~INCI6288.1.p1  ORF type:complete len:626 (+),score=124.89 INCI6288.1:101-1978(+)
MSRCSFQEFVVVASGIGCLAAAEFGLLHLLDVPPRHKGALFMTQGVVGCLVFAYLTYKYCGQPKRVPVRRVGHDGEVIINSLTNETWALTVLQRVKISCTAVTLLPFRIILFVLALVLAVVFSLLATVGLSQKSLSNEPLSSARLFLRKPVGWCFRVVLFSLGFVWIRYRGKMAPTSDAPVKVGAPHMSMIEPVAFMCVNLGMFVAEASNFQFGPLKWLVQCMQPILFDRFDPDSRRKCGEDQVERATNPKWHKGGALCVFPEGATHNQQELYVFKTGAFRMGVPVQPVAIKIPFRWMDCSWCTAGPGASSLLLRAMCQFVNFMQLTYLPVHTPTVAEKKDARLFANNVQKAIGESLGVGVSNHSIEDNKLMDLIRATVGREDTLRPNIIDQTAAVAVAHRFEFRSANELLGISIKEARQYLKHFLQHGGKDGLMDFAEFKRTFPSMDAKSQREMFALMDVDHDGRIEFHEFLIKVALLNERINLDAGAKEKSPSEVEADQDRFRKAVALAYDVLAMRSESDQMSTDSLRALLQTAFPDLSVKDVDDFVAEADKDGNGTLTREEFLQFCTAHQDAKNAVRDVLFPGVAQIGSVVQEGLANEEAAKAAKAKAKKLKRHQMDSKKKN